MEKGNARTKKAPLLFAYIGIVLAPILIYVSDPNNIININIVITIMLGLIIIAAFVLYTNNVKGWLLICLYGAVWPILLVFIPTYGIQNLQYAWNIESLISYFIDFFWIMIGGSGLVSLSLWWLKNTYK